MAMLSSFQVYKDVLHVRMAKDQAVRVESDGAVTLSPNIEVTGEMTGSFLGALGRQMLSGESFFQQILRCSHGSHGEATIAPKYPGDIKVVDDINGMPLYMRAGAYLASGEHVNVRTVTQPGGMIGGVFSGNGLFVLEASGRGPLAFAAFGSTFTRELGPNQHCLVDNGHVVAWDASMTYTMELANKQSMVSSFTSGEGLMCKFRGPGTVWVQSRNTDAFKEWFRSDMSSGKRSGGPAGPLLSFCFLGVFCCFGICFFGVFIYAIMYADSQGDVDLRYG